MASFTDAITRTTADDLYYTNIVDAAVIDAAYSATVMRGLCRERSLIGQPSNTHKFPAWPALAAASVAENADLSNTALATTGVDLTLGEVGIMLTPTDVLREDSILANDLAELGRQAGMAIADKVDADIAALLDGFSNSTGSDADALTYTDFISGLRGLESRDAPKPYVAVLHPVQVGQLHNDVAANGGAFWGAGVQDNDSRFAQLRSSEGSLAGVPIYSTTNVPSSGTTGHAGAIFSRGVALGFVIGRESRTEFDRDASARLTEIVVTTRYATGELIDNYGQELLSDSTAS